MRPPGSPDCLIVIDGPEDGNEFPISRSPFYIGQDAACAVNIRLDTTVESRHARLTAVADGYRVRAMPGAQTFVGSKRVGSLRSRIVRSGDTLTVGHVTLALECAPDGLAKRSKGIPVENDVIWAFRSVPRVLLGWLLRLSRGLSKLVFMLFRLVLRFLAFLLKNWQLTAIVAIILLSIYSPPCRRFIQNFISSTIAKIMSLADPS